MTFNKRFTTRTCAFRRLVGLALLALGLLGQLWPGARLAASQDLPARPIVYVLPIEGVIDLGLAPFVQRVIDEATQAGAAALIPEIDTFGGRVDAAVQIRDALLNTPLRTVGFVNKRAISAGALIGLATQTLELAFVFVFGAVLLIRFLYQRLRRKTASRHGQAERAVRAEPACTAAEAGAAAARVIGPPRYSPKADAKPVSSCAPRRARRYTRDELVPDRPALRDAIVISAILQPCLAQGARDIG